MATYCDLIIRCPACIAVKDKYVGPVVQWYHANCGGKIQIGDDAYLRCVSCGDRWHIRYARYACSEHESDYRSTTRAHFSNAISALAQCSSIATMHWYKTLLDNMGDDW